MFVRLKRMITKYTLHEPSVYAQLVLKTYPALATATTLLHIHPAIHMQGDAGDVARTRPGQKSHGSGDVGRQAETFQRHVLDQFGALFFTQALGHVVVDEAGRDAVHGDVAAADLLRQRFGEAYHAGLGSRIVGLPGIAHAADRSEE